MLLNHKFVTDHQGEAIDLAKWIGPTLFEWWRKKQTAMPPEAMNLE